MDRRTLLAAATSSAILAAYLGRPALAQNNDHSDWKRDFSALPGVKLMGNEEIAMLLYPGFTALDLVGPYHFFAGMMGAKVHLVTNQTDLTAVTSDMGLAIQPTVTMRDCPTDLTILFAPGGTDGTIAAARDDRTLEFVRDRAAQAQFVTSVCTGALILGVAGLLRGRRATTHWSIRHLLGQFGATPVDARVVEDGGVITGAGVSAGLDFGLAIVSRLRGRPYAAASMLTAEYRPEPPFDGGTPSTSPDSVSTAMTSLFAPFVIEALSLRGPG